jgi:hypothetical protein
MQAAGETKCERNWINSTELILIEANLAYFWPLLGMMLTLSAT